MGLKGTITSSNAAYFIKQQFHVKDANKFNEFEACERLEITKSILEEEIDFEYFCGMNIITEHYPLHRGNTYFDLADLFKKHKFKLMIGFITGDFEKKIYPLNLMKSYFGPKMAFEFAFLLHY